MTMEMNCQQGKLGNGDLASNAETLPSHQVGRVDYDEAHIPVANCSQTNTADENLNMKSHGSCNNGGSGGMSPSARTEGTIAQGVQSLKQLSLNGLNRNIGETSVAGETASASMSSSKHLSGEIPKPRLSWGDITEIPSGATERTRPFAKRPIVPASSSENSWQVRATQNPSRPLVRRPTPMALNVPKSVLGKGSSKMMSGSFEEGEEEEEEEEEKDGEDGAQGEVKGEHVSKVVRDDSLIVEDVTDEEFETKPAGVGVALPDSLPLQGKMRADPNQISPDTDSGSPTIVVQDDLGKQVSSLEAADDEEDDDDVESDDEDGEDDEVGDLDTKQQFLELPSKSSTYGKNPEPVSTNTHVQHVPHQHKKLVRRATPLALDVPKELLSPTSKNKEEMIIEEEEEEEEEEEIEKSKESSTKDQSDNDASSRSVFSTGTIQEQSDQEQLGDSSMSSQNNNAASMITRNEDNALSNDRPDIINSVNCNNNHTDTTSLDLVEGAAGGGNTLKTDSARSESPSRFRKSVTSGSGSSPSAVRKKIKPQTKILTRKLTPLQIDVPKHVLPDSMKNKPPDAFVEMKEEEEEGI